MQNLVIAITGPASSGKTTTAKKLAKQIEQCVNIDADDIKHMIVNGFTYDDSPEGIKQFALLGKNIGALTQNFQEENYNVIISGYINEPAWDNIDKYVQLTHKFLLLPRLETIKARDNNRRPIEHRMGEEAIARHYDYFSNSDFFNDFIKIDSSNDTVDSTVEKLFKLL